MTRLTPLSRLTRLTRLAQCVPAIALLAAVAAFAACNPGGSTTPSLVLPSFALPSIALPSVGASLSVSASGVTGCVDPATFAILSQLQSPGADAASLIDQNKPALIAGLQAFQPPDSATATWRDQLVTALQANDTATATAKLQMLASGEVSISSC
jgi:hypothetical protein